jgi:hypothetical protein
MKINEKQRLCGGTFFTLILQARKPRMGVREHYMSNTDGLSEPKTLIALAKVMMPDMQEPLESMMKTIKGNVFDYKTCKNAGGTYFPFGDADARTAFDTRVKTEYRTALADMSEFVDGFIDVGGSTKKDERLVIALVELINLDDSIVNEQLFYVCEDGTAILKSDLLVVTDICLQPFLLGVWHFAVLRNGGNTIGKETYDAWCPAQGGGQRKYTATLGANLGRTIQLLYHTGQNPDVSDGEVSELDEDCRAQGENVSLKDTELLSEFKSDYTPIIEYCINTDFSAELVNINLSDKIASLYNDKWRFRSRDFADAHLRKLKNNILAALNELTVYLSDRYLRLHEGFGQLIFRNQSWEEGDRLREELRPNTIRIREKLRDLYLELYPDPDADNDTVEPEIEQDAPQSQVLQQNVNNPFVFNFTQNGNSNTQIGHVENYYGTKKE